MRVVLRLLISLITVTAVCSGILMIYAPDGSLLKLSPDLLQSSPFRNYVVPGIILCLIVGGVNFFAVINTNPKNRQSYRYSLLGGIVLAASIIVQMFFLPSYHWLQIVFITVAVLVILLSYQLMGKAVF